METKKRWKSEPGTAGGLPGKKSNWVLTMALLFFIMSFAGWLWEVCLHWVTTGSFVNRGFLHGPWLPIYGFGSVLILVLPGRLRKKPLLEFLAILLLCGTIEYGVSWLLEQIYDGMKWWDYSEYCLNLDGRICAEGLLAFGLGGMGLVHFAAPLLMRLSEHIPERVRLCFVVMMVLIFCFDLVYSGGNPNMGNGIAGCNGFSKERLVWIRSYC